MENVSYSMWFKSYCFQFKSNSNASPKKFRICIIKHSKHLLIKSNEWHNNKMSYYKKTCQIYFESCVFLKETTKIHIFDAILQEKQQICYLQQQQLDTFATRDSSISS